MRMASIAMMTGGNYLAKYLSGNSSKKADTTKPLKLTRQLT